MNEKIKLAVAGALLLAACDVKDPIYHTSHPDSGTITLTTDWSGIGQGVQVPASYTVRVGEYSAPLSGTTHTLDNYFAPGTYRAYVYNTPEHILVSEATASVENVTTPQGQSEPFVNSAPGWLFTSAMDAVIERDKDHAFTALMQQQVRELTLVIEPTGGSIERIASIEGRLSGAAGSLDLDNGTHGTPSNVALTFSKIASGANAGKWSATVRLLGTAGGQQKLNAQINFTGGNPSAVNLESDLTSALAAFNADKREPLTLGGSVVEMPTGMGFEATIEHWEAVEPVEGDATLPEPDPAKIGDYFYSDGSYSTELNPDKTVIGIVFQTDPARIGAAEKEALREKGVIVPRGLVMALKNTGTDVPWSTERTDTDLPNVLTVAACYEDINGLSHTRAVWSFNSYTNAPETYPAFKAVADYTVPAPGCTTGWFLPSIGQMWDLLENLGNVAALKEQRNRTSQLEETYWTNQGDVPAALNAWMAQVAPEDKHVFPVNNWIWSSSEIGIHSARRWCVRFIGHVDCSTNDKVRNSHEVRPVLAF